ncbi:methyl-accepting chemotaxis protein [uncultured Shimia sp.]|uniref:methyl-accepting chemotaxis protein n=1 Tax=uncultured Shimia sp. TaxID=573152 RepID=UPI002617A8A6|nr:methyl-accepting chemotaxis protein [uncultured Shimia sp.]
MSIKTKLAVAIAACALLAVGLSQFSQYNARTAEAEAQAMERYDLLTELFSTQLVAAAQFQDVDRLKATTDRFLEQDAHITAVSVLASDGTEIYTYDAAETRADSVNQALSGVSASVTDAKPSAHAIEGAVYAAHMPIAQAGRAPVGSLQVAADVSSIRQEALQEFVKGAIGSSLAAALALGLIVMLVGRVVTRPVLSLGKAMDAIADHDFTYDVPCLDRDDEIGAMAKRLEKFRTQLAQEERDREMRAAQDKQRQRLFARLAEGLSEIADGRVDRPIDVTEFSHLGENSQRICKDFNEVLTNLKSVLSTVTRTAETVRSSAQEISESVVDQSKRSEAQAVTLEESAAAIETLSTSVEQTADHAAEANKRITQNRQQAQSGGEVVELTVEAMRNIEQSSDKITAIIGVIDDIAFQTNLLALNAGVEAARAGEAGRGFAVVASEVRALAQRASESANEIKELILTSGEQVTKGSELVNKAGDALQEIITGVNHASDLVSQIATGSRDQADNLREIKESVTELDRVTQRNAAMIEESSAASRSLSDEAANMSQALKVFKLTEADVVAASAPAAPKPAPKKAAAAAKPAPKAAKPAPAKPVADVAKTKEWDDDAAKDAKLSKAKVKKTSTAKPSPKAVQAAKPMPKPTKAAVNQTAPVQDTASEDWEDF